MRGFSSCDNSRAPLQPFLGLSPSQQNGFVSLCETNRGINQVSGFGEEEFRPVTRHFVSWHLFWPVLLPFGERQHPSCSWGCFAYLPLPG